MHVVGFAGGAFVAALRIHCTRPNKKARTPDPGCLSATGGDGRHVRKQGTHCPVFRPATREGRRRLIRHNVQANKEPAAVPNVVTACRPILQQVACSDPLSICLFSLFSGTDCTQVGRWRSSEISRLLARLSPPPTR